MGFCLVGNELSQSAVGLCLVGNVLSRSPMGLCLVGNVLLSWIAVDFCLQEREANLDVVMDRMRQDATEEALRDSLGKALEMLEKIRES